MIDLPAFPTKKNIFVNYPNEKVADGFAATKNAKMLKIASLLI